LALQLGVCSSCGFRIDCPPTYDLPSLNATFSPAELQLHAEQLAAARVAAVAGCRNASVNQHAASGSWCLYGSKQRGRFRLPNWHHSPDGRVVSVLAKLLKEWPQSHGEVGDKKATPRYFSLNDLGAGVGQYGQALRELDPAYLYRGYDGAGNVEAWSNGFVTWVDMSMPLSLPLADWVMSLDVGEHIPPAHEGMYLRNLHAHNCRGIIISWSPLGKPGNGHINNHRTAYIVERMRGLGYWHDTNLSRALRNSQPGPGMQVHWWVTKGINAFRRYTPLVREGCTTS